MMRHVNGCCNNQGRAFRFVSASLLATALIGIAHPVLADQRPALCEVNGLTMTIQQSAAVAAVGDSISFSVRFDNDGAGNCDVTGVDARLILPNGVVVPLLSNETMLAPDGVAGDSFTCPGDARCVSNDSNDYRYIVSASNLDGTRNGCPPGALVDPGRAFSILRAVAEITQGNVHLNIFDVPDGANQCRKAVTIFPRVIVTKTGSVSEVCSGVTTPITYSFTVHNPSDTMLQFVDVFDDDCDNMVRLSDLSGDDDILLEPNETWRFVCNTTVTGAFTNTVNVTAQETTIGAVVSDQASFAVTEVAAPSCSTPISTAQSVCPNTGSHFASVPNAGQGVSYFWNVAGGSVTSGQGTPNITYSAGSGTTVSLSVTLTNASGCSCTRSTTVQVNSTVNCTITAGVACRNASGNVASVPSAGIGATYSWSVSGGTITSGQNSPSIAYTAGAGSFVTISVNVTTPSGCQCSNSRIVSLSTNTNCTITAAASACRGSIGNTASVASAGSGASYSWTVTGGTLTSGQNTPSITYSAGFGSAVTIFVTVSGANLCQCSSSVQVPLSLANTCSISTASQVCPGTSAHSASVPTAGFGASYQWTVSGGSITSGQNSPTITYTAGTGSFVSISVNVTSTSGCACSASIQVSLVDVGCPTGACCLGGQTCIRVTRTQCTVQGGLYRGDFTNCGGGFCVPDACETCPSNINTPIRLGPNGTVLVDLDDKKAACPQAILFNSPIDPANTNINDPLEFPLNGGGFELVHNPYWDPLGPARASTGGGVKSADQADVNIMEIVACDSDTCGINHNGFPAGPPLVSNGIEKCENLFSGLAKPGVVFGKEGKIISVLVRQRCLAQQRLDQNKNPIRDGNGNQMTTPLCVRGYQVWLEFNPNVVQIDSIIASPIAADGPCIQRDSPFRQGIFSFDTVQNGKGVAFASAGINASDCPTADDAVIAIFRFRVLNANGDAGIRIDPAHLSANLSPGDRFGTTVTQWTKDTAGRPVLPNAQNNVTVVADNLGPVFVPGLGLATCTIQSPLVVECGRGNPLFGGDFRTDVSPSTMIALDNVLPENVIPLLVSPINMFDAPACLTFTDQVIPLCGFQADVKRTWFATDCAGNVTTCPLQVIQIRDRSAPESQGPELEISCVGDIPAPMITNLNGDFVLDSMEFSMIGTAVNGRLVKPGILWDRCGQVSARFAGDFTDTDKIFGPGGVIIDRLPNNDFRITSTSLDVCTDNFCPATIWRLYVAEDFCEKQKANVWMKITIVRKQRPTLISGSWVKNIDTFADALVAGSSEAIQRANAGLLCAATVDVNLISPRARDECGCVLSRQSGLGTFSGDRSDSTIFNLRDVNDPYPEGCTTITWTIKDCDGNELFEPGTDPIDQKKLKTTVCVEPFNIVVSDVEYGITSRSDLPVLDDFRRCIAMELAGCTNGARVEQETLMNFRAVGKRLVPVDACGTDKPSRTVFVYAAVEAKFLVPCGIYDCATARDILHTLASKNDASDRVKFGVDTSVSPWRYKASFTGVRSDEESYCAASPFLHDNSDLRLIDAGTGANGEGQFTNKNRLVVGNLNDDTFIDIDDFGIFSASLGMIVANDSCETKPFHADSVPDSVVDILDFGTIATNFLLVSEAPCCTVFGVSAATVGPRSSVTVEQLRREGKAALAAGDLNHDGVLDVSDMEAFAAGVRPVPVSGDLDFDGDVDTADSLAFLACFSTSTDAVPLNCRQADLDGDGDVDLSDFVSFQTAFTGAR